MSSAQGYAGVQDVWPTYGYDTSPPVSTGHVTSGLPHVSVADMSHSVDHVVHGVAHALHELLEPAAIALGAMSGALLAGRAAMAATGVLAHAAVRAAEEQRCLLRQQESARDAAQQWESAAFAAVRVNARRTVLAARLARLKRETPPGSPPPAPVLPPPVQPVGCRLDVTRQTLAEAERALEQAEAELAAWACATAVADVADARDTSWQRVLAERRRPRRRTGAGTPPAAEPARPSVESEPVPVTRARGADEDEVTSASAELLGALPVEATPEDSEPVVTALHHALICVRAGDGISAAEHLEEARIFAADVGRRVRLRADALFQAAAQLDFLTTEVPSDVEPAPPAEDVLALLREAVAEGRPLRAADRDRARAAVDDRLEQLERRYLQQGAEHVLGALGGEPALWHDTASGARCAAFAPPGWEPDHWIEVTVHPDGLDLVTCRGGPPSPIDAERCAEAKQWAAGFEQALARLGLECDFRFDSEAVAPRSPDAAPRTASGSSGRERPGRSRDDLRRRDDGPRHRQIDDRDGRH
ncbi:hypothetical protein [Streptomyces panaciradicis]|uniref:hypothetical protein n=1 Tax=Streptomyces panaciradicis TaxID=1470261 RepID=UPI00201D1C04|nr:hypothetical protein [Streptomyces panaciradicis]MCL6671549.1 hypothetical protein [Streptomyces panaciradicis]